jgi:hypothetical protein
MKRLFMITAAIAALALGSVAAYATNVTVSPWAYSCGNTDFASPTSPTITRADIPDSNGCPSADVPGEATALMQAVN